MRNLFLVIQIYVLLSFIGCSQSDVDVSGDIFIVTKGAQNIKLGLVQVGIFSDNVIQQHMLSKHKVAEKALAKIEPMKRNLELDASMYKQIVDMVKLAYKYGPSYEVKKKLDKDTQEYSDILNQIKKNSDEIKYYQGAFYYEGLPSPLFTAKTDADGKFTLKLKPGKYALAAAASREVPGDTEDYYWLIWITVDPKQQNKIMLSNDNFFRSSDIKNSINPAVVPK
jgi:hypothetical protein